jgi:2-enoate reductase
MVIGGGVAGMEAARVAALRGQRVLVYEKSDRLGGHLIEASIMPFKADDQRLLDWYERELNRLAIEIHLDTEVTPGFVQEQNADAVVVATGSRPILLNVTGIDKEMVVMASDLLLNRRKAGQQVVVVGGGRVGCETALWLAQQGKQVTIVENLDDLMLAGPPLPLMNRMMLLDLLTFHRVNAMTKASLHEVTDGGTTVIDESLRVETIAADTVVIAVGLEP